MNMLAGLIIALAWAFLSTVLLVYVLVDWQRTNLSATRYRNGYEIVHKAFEDLKDRLKKEAAVQIPMDHYYVFANFSRHEFAIMMSGVMAMLEHVADKSWKPDDYRRLADLADKIRKIVSKIDKSEAVNPEELQNLVRRGMAVAFLHKETHKRNPNKDYIPEMV